MNQARQKKKKALISMSLFYLSRRGWTRWERTVCSPCCCHGVRL